MSNTSAYQSLITRLDAFIRKYYKNQMIRGAIYCVALIVGSYLLVTLLEYFGRFNIAMRTFLFWSFVITALFVLVRFFAIPLFKMMKLGKNISHEQAAQIIGKHFPNVQDKLLNTLQLKERESEHEDNSLLEASINQRIAELRPVPFSSAIDLRENRKYLKWALPPLSVFLILLFAAPSILTKPTQRLIKHGEFFAEEAPFQINVKNDKLETPENADFTVNIEVTGNEIPDKIYVVQNGQQWLAERDNPLSFSYTFKNVQKDTPFAFYGGGFYSDQYELKVIPTPHLLDFQVHLNYPDYVKRTDEDVRNTGDLLVPQGTRITWEFATANTDAFSIHFNDSTYALSGEDEYTFSQTALNTNEYWLHTANQYMSSQDSIRYRLQVVPDVLPMIAVTEERDSASYKQLYFSGEVRDDYGFRRLTFNYQFTYREVGGVDNTLHTVEMPVTKEHVTDEFFYNWDLNTLELKPGDKINYYFEVWDNDGVNGSKASRSGMREYAAPTEEQLEENLEDQNEEIKEKLEEAVKDAKELEKALEELQRQLMEKKEMSWQDKKKLEELMKKQQELQQQVNEIREQNQQKNQQQSEFEKPNEKLQEKQKQLEELMNQVMTPELQKLMEEMQRLMEELNKDEIQKELDKMDLNNEDLEKELDRALEQFKQLEWEQKMEKAIDKLKELGEKQEELSKESEKKETKSEELEKKQEELNKEFEELKKELDEAEKLNEELENPNPMPDTEQKQEEIDQEQKESKESLSKNKKSSASKSQKSAGDKMKEMAEQMEMAMNASEQEQQEIDMEALRALLENIITLSFDQEELMSQFKTIDQKDPNYNKLGHTQRKLKDDSKMVEDSLFALSKRVPQISAAVNHEINLVNENMDHAIASIPDRRTADVTTSQQYVMTSFNNLALMLDEALQQMQQQSQSECNKPGSGSCNKPGGKGKKPAPSAGDLKKMQEKLAKQLEEMKKQGKNQGKSGEGGQMSEQLAKMAAMQSAIRKAVEEKAAEMNEDGSGTGNEMKQISKEMEEIQKDIVNNQIDEETIRRQRDIEIRLLKAEEAERIRGQEEKRKSNEATDYPTSNPQKYEAYIRKKQQETELLKTVPPSLKPYYKEKVNSYFNKLGTK
ncbi:MAG: DUF4175 family protein [Flavobacteriales bacterium]